MQAQLCLPKSPLTAKRPCNNALHALPSQALRSIWMSLILKPFAPDIIFANDRTQRRGFAFVGGSSTQGVHWRPEIRTFILHPEWKTSLAVEPLAAESPQNPQGP